MREASVGFFFFLACSQKRWGSTRLYPFAWNDYIEEIVTQTSHVAYLSCHGLLMNFVWDSLVCLRLSDAPVPRCRFFTACCIQVSCWSLLCWDIFISHVGNIFRCTSCVLRVDPVSYVMCSHSIINVKYSLGRHLPSMPVLFRI
jgi:hypothetical protein